MKAPTRPPLRHVEPDVRPLGWLALGAALVALALAPTYFLSAFAFVAALVAVPLGLLARGDQVTRRLGTAALVVTGVALVLATAALL